MRKLERARHLSAEQFIEQYLRPNRPVIVCGAIDDWQPRDSWTVRSLSERFGSVELQIYDDLFDLRSIDRLSDYLERNFNLPPSQMPTGYVRGYTKFRDVDFYWADEIFAAISNEWCAPSFFPCTGLVLPSRSNGETACPTIDAFPYRGLFISGRGCRTRVHRDPYDSEAILCQVQGTKQVRFFSPSRCDELLEKPGTGSPDDLGPPDYEDLLDPGEVLFIPGGWFHEVETLSDSISLTWNFVHEGRQAGFWNALASGLSARDREVVDFFLSDPRAARLEGQL